jgi:phosphohistidine phosphatase
VPTLVVVRHAKAEEPRAGLSDHDRALTLEGRKAATRLGERLAAAGIEPDCAFVSSANRAQQTWARVAGAFSDARFEVVPGLYHGGLGAYQDALAAAAGAEVAVTVAHEPTASGFAKWLANDASDREALASIAWGLVTSGAAILELASWDDLRTGGARLVAVLSGKA